MVNVENLTIGEFEKMLSETDEKCVIVFCAGQALHELCGRYPVLRQKILYAVDNHVSSGQVDIQDIIVPVRSTEQLGEEVRKSILLISSLRYADELVVQMDDISLLEQCKVYIPDLFEDTCTGSIPRLMGANLIPKKIHYCWFGHGEMPEQFKANIETWKKYCPDYEIIRWDESNYDVTKNKYMYQAYEMKKWGFVPDYARLDIIYQHGGIYLDTDVEVIKPLDDLLQYKMFCGFEAIDLVNFGQGFGAQKQHPVLKCMMDDYDKESFIKKDGSLNLIPSPIYQTKVLEKLGLVKNGQMQKYDNFVVLPTECLAPINAYGVGCPNTGTFSIHWYAATWYDELQQKNKEKAIRSSRYLLSRMSKKG